MDYGSNFGRYNREKDYYANIAHDSRVVRGSTLTYIAKKKKKGRRLKKRVKKKQIYKEYDFPNQQADISSGEEEERNNMAIDLTAFLEEDVKPVKKKNIDCQTDKFTSISLPSEEEKYFPIKSGIDRSTQVDEKLFDFEKSSKPLIDVIVGKTLEQSLMEVVQEEEISNLKNRQKSLIDAKNKETEGINNQERLEKERYENARKKLREENELDRKKKVAKRKLTAFMYSRRLGEKIVKKILNQMAEDGEFADDRKKNVQSFLPMLFAGVSKEIENKKKEAQILNSLMI